MKTRFARKEDYKDNRRWYHVDADGLVLGRLATRLATALMGKDRPDYTPHVDSGACVIVINAARVLLTGGKEDKKIYQDYSGYNSGRKEHTARQVRAKHPDRIIRQAVRGMLPKNRLARRMMTRLKVYPGAEHPHAAQQPQTME